MITTAEALLTLAITFFGEPDHATIVIKNLLAKGDISGATEAFIEAYQDYFDEEEFVDDVDECGFDPYEGCYTYDC